MRARLVAVGIALAGCATAGKHAARERLPLMPQPDRLLAENLIEADHVVAGRLTDVDEAIEYEPLGHLTFGLFGTKVVVPAAYKGKIRVDSTLLGSARRTLWITFFAPEGAQRPQEGETAIWVLHRRTLWRLQRCGEQQSFTSTACPYDVGLALDSDDDVRPVAEWPRIHGILRTLGLGPAR